MQSLDSDQWPIRTDIKELQRMIREARDAAYLRYLDATKASATLKRSIQALAMLIHTRDAATANTVSTLVSACEDGLVAQAAANHELLELIPPLYRKPPRSAELATTVFGTVEILEHVLECLPAADILSAYSVNRAFHDTIEGSLRLQRKLGLSPDPNGFFAVPAMSLVRLCSGMRISYPGSSAFGSGFRSCRKTEMKDSARSFEIQVFMESKRRLPKIGSRCAKLQVSQPPIKVLRLHPQCCESPGPRGVLRTSIFGYREPRPAATVTSTTGITFGQLFEAVSRVRSAHALCAEAGIWDHDEDGFVCCRVLAEGELSLHEDDPIVNPKGVTEISRQKSKGGTQVRPDETRMRAYMNAKGPARANGRSMPTLAEFEARPAGPFIEDDEQKHQIAAHGLMWRRRGLASRLLTITASRYRPSRSLRRGKPASSAGGESKEDRAHRDGLRVWRTSLEDGSVWTSVKRRGKGLEFLGRRASDRQIAVLPDEELDRQSS